MNRLSSSNAFYLLFRVDNNVIRTPMRMTRMRVYALIVHRYLLLLLFLLLLSIGFVAVDNTPFDCAAVECEEVHISFL